MAYPLVCMYYGLFLGMAAAQQPESTADFPRVVKSPDAASAEDLGMCTHEMCMPFCRFHCDFSMHYSFVHGHS